MENQKVNRAFKSFSKSISNNSYLDLLERYILIDKTADLDNKHKEWSKKITNS